MNADNAKCELLENHYRHALLQIVDYYAKAGNVEDPAAVRHTASAEVDEAPIRTPIDGGVSISGPV